MEKSELDRINDLSKTAVEEHLDRRAHIFMEEAIANYLTRHSIKDTIYYLEQMIEQLKEFG